MTHRPFCIIQISDLHLNSTTCIGAQRLLYVLDMIVNDGADLLLLTGDLVNDGKAELYDWLFDKLNKTGIHHLCLAGNHDVTQELGANLPFEDRQYLPIATDPRLIEQQNLPLIIDDAESTWQLLALHSAVAGQAYGKLSDATLVWLDDNLTNSCIPTLIALHHHPLPVGSAWIDDLMLANTDALWRIIAKHPHVKAVLCGHVHQSHTLTTPQACTLYTCPAISRQFIPFSDEFAADDTLFGYRVIQLGREYKITSYINYIKI